MGKIHTFRRAANDNRREPAPTFITGREAIRRRWEAAKLLAGVA